ncbi:MAG: biotin/lipoyl-binding protein, partial [Muribaculaceae bacterium]|nr:biotin/lipoyl-binding protein [Muribaculaceae bacterium]
MKKYLKIFLWILIAAVFIGTFVYLYISNRPKEDVYETVTPATETIERSTVLTGKIEPRDEIEIKPQISGIIAEVLVEAGDQVKAGDVIARIKVIPDESQLSSAQSRVSVAKISLEEARQAFERTRNLYERKFESREKYETDMHAYDRARQELAQAEDQLAIVKEGVSSLNAQGSNTLVRS